MPTDHLPGRLRKRARSWEKYAESAPCKGLSITAERARGIAAELYAEAARKESIMNQAMQPQGATHA